jgi:hypothetical protein
MSNTDVYRGYSIPESIKVDGWYWIIDDHFGQHWGYTADIATQSWERSVDNFIIQDALEMGLVERIGSSDELACLECGLKIHDVFAHLSWHRTH